MSGSAITLRRSVGGILMRLKALSLLGVRLIAVYLIVQGLTVLPQFWTMTRFANHAHQNPAVFAIGAVMTLAPMVVGVLLWSVAPWLGNWIAPSSPAEPLTATAGELVQGGIGVVGLTIATTAIPGIIENIGWAVSSAQDGNLVLLQYCLGIGRGVALVILGICLVAGAKRLKTWIFHLREMGA